MTLYLAKRVIDGAVDETTSVYIARCDAADCRYLADHVSQEVVEDALDGHRARAHRALGVVRTEETTRTGWIPAWSYGSEAATPPPATGVPPAWSGPVAAETASEDAPPPWVETADATPWSPSPKPREET